MSNIKDLYQIVLSKEQPSVYNDCSFFFHSKAFIERDSTVQTSYVSLFKGANQPIATVPFNFKNHAAYSLLKSPFGGINAVDEITSKELQYLIDHLINLFRERQLETIKITSFPHIYNAKMYDLSQDIFLNAGFKMSSQDIGQYLIIDKAFSGALNSSEKRYLNNAKKNEYVFRQLKVDQLESVYELIKSSRENKGYPVTMSFSALKETVSQFPKEYLIFGLYHNTSLIAASVCIRVNSQILYNFYLGDNLNYRKNSPAVPLIGEIYNYARINGYRILDLGLSTDHGTVNEGLFKFKENLGASPTKKPTYILSL